MSCSTEFVPRLHALGFRVTPQRLAILHVLLESRSHLSPSQVYERARQGVRGLTQPTVYRTLEFLSKNGLAQSALNGNKHVVYQIPRHDHHHVVCSRCGASMEIADSSVLHLHRDLQRHSGYQLSASHLTLFGLCPACQRSDRKA